MKRSTLVVNMEDTNYSIKKLIYILASVLVLLTLISCRGASTTKSLLAATTQNQQATNENQEELKQTEKEHAEIITASRQLKSILDVRLESTTPLRMEGVVITTQTNPVTIRSFVPDNILYSVVSESNKDSIDMLYQLVKAKELNISMDLKARLIPTGSEKSAIEAFETVMQNSKNYSKACFPISIALSKNFYDKTNPESKKDFCATIKMNEGIFSGFQLYDIKSKPIGTITMPITSSLNSKEYKMIIEYDEEIKLISQQHKIKQSHTLILQMNEVSTIKNDYKKQ